MAQHHRKSVLVPKQIEYNEIIVLTSSDEEMQDIENKSENTTDEFTVTSKKTSRRQENMEGKLEKLIITRKTPRKISPVKRYIEESEEQAVKTSEAVPKRNSQRNDPQTPIKLIERLNPKTPNSLRTRIKKQLKKIKTIDLSSSSESYSNDSEDEAEEDVYRPTNEESSSDSADGEEEKEEVDYDYNTSISDYVDPEEIKKNKLLELNLAAAPLARIREKKTNYQSDFFLQSDDYFAHSHNKHFTSDRTLDSLKTPRLQHDQLFKLLENMKTSAEHEKSITEMIHEYRLNFKKWIFLMDEGFSILLYGLGSKRNLLESFHKQILSKRDVLVVNGFFPSLNIKDILENIANKLLELNISMGNLNLVVDLIEEECLDNLNHHIFLIIHNIDGVMLRNDKSQTILCRLAKIPNFHLIASIDHINAPMLWNPSKLANFNFSWWDVTTMLPYASETAFENSLLVQNSGALALSSIKNVFQSLTSNAKGVYILIVKYQIDNNKVPHYQGMAFKELYSKCRESFLVSSDLALRAQLTEFLDHKLVKTKRSTDGTEYLSIPIENKLLQQFLEQQS